MFGGGAGGGGSGEGGGGADQGWRSSLGLQMPSSMGIPMASAAAWPPLQQQQQPAPFPSAGDRFLADMGVGMSAPSLQRAPFLSPREALAQLQQMGIAPPPPQQQQQPLQPPWAAPHSHSQAMAEPPQELHSGGPPYDRTAARSNDGSPTAMATSPPAAAAAANDDPAPLPKNLSSLEVARALMAGAGSAPPVYQPDDAMVRCWVNGRGGEGGWTGSSPPSWEVGGMLY